MARQKRNHWSSDGPMPGMPGRRRYITAMGPSAYFFCISGDCMSFMSGQWGTTYPRASALTPLNAARTASSLGSLP